MATMESDDFVIEEIDSNDVPDEELSQFKETQLLNVVEIIDESPSEDISKSKEDEGVLINRYIQGEGEFPELYTKLEPGEEDEDDCSVEEAEQRQRLHFNKNANILSTSKVLDQISDDSDDELDYAATVSQRKPQCMSLDSRPSTSQQTPPRKRGALNANTSSLQQTRKTGGMGRRSVLNPALLGLMGEANLSLVRGDTDTAKRICLEIIRQNPLACEPFYTLADIYESVDSEKFLNVLTIAAHLNSHDRHTWIRIAEIHIMQGNLQRARVSYSKAIKALSKDYDLRMRRARCLEQMGDTTAAMFGYLKTLPLMPLHEAELCLSTAKSVARHYHRMQRPVLALEAMESAYAVCGKRFELEDVNLYMELLILNKLYAKVLSCLRESTNLELETEQDQDRELIYFCAIPDDYVPDLRTKLCVCLIHMHAHHLLGYLIQNIHKHVPVTEERIDQYMDITEALIQEHKYAEAIALMHPITDGDTVECPPFVWLRQAECLRQLNRTNEAIESYARVVELAPVCYEAKFTLSALLKQQGRHVEAVKALEQSGECEGQPLHARLLYERCIMLQEIGRIDEFLEVGYVLLGRHSIKLKNRQEMMAASSGGSFYNADSMRTILQMRNFTEGESTSALQELQKPPKETSDLTTQDEYTLFLELVRTAYEHHKYSVMERICFAMLTTKRFTSFHVDLERIIILACYFNNDAAIGFSYLRDQISKNCAHINLWNLLSLIIQRTGDDLRYFRYTRRIATRQPAVPRVVRILMGHYHMNCSSYKYALNVYVPLFREQPQALVAFCIAVIFNQLALQKKVLRKSASVAQALAFMHKYAELRAGNMQQNSAAQQEIYYNMGRLYHQAGLVHMALTYYERALAVQHPLIEQNESCLGLKHEIGYNMHLIYRASGNAWKARQCLYRYCVI